MQYQAMLKEGCSDSVRLLYNKDGRHFLTAIKRNATDPDFFDNFEKGLVNIEYANDGIGTFEGIFYKGKKIFPVIRLQMPL